MARRVVYVPPVLSVSGKWQKNNYTITENQNGKANKYFEGTWRELTQKASYSWNTWTREITPTANVQTARANFKTAWENVATVMADSAKLAAARERFARQTKYKYIRTFIFHEEMAKLV